MLSSSGVTRGQGRIQGGGLVWESKPPLFGKISSIC